jgi:hypothetical protein
LLNSDKHVIKIVERNVNIDYSFVLKNVFDKFIDKSISWNTIFLKSKQIMPLDKANIPFVINTNSCELKVHSKNKCLKVSTSKGTEYL